MAVITAANLTAPTQSGQAKIVPVTPLPMTPDKRLDTQEAPATTTEEVTEVKKQDALSPKFAALAKKERALREQARAVAQSRAEFEAQKAELESMKSWKTRLSEDPLSVLTEAGLSGDDLTQALLNQSNPQEQKFQKLQLEMKRIQDAQAEAQKRATEASQTQYEQAIKQIEQQVSLLVDGNDEFEAIKDAQAEKAVRILIEETFKEDGTLLDVETAAKEVEEYLVEDALRRAKLKKIQSRLNPTPPAAPAAQAKKKEPEPEQSQTLSTRMSQAPSKPMTARERKERAILAFQGKLN